MFFHLHRAAFRPPLFHFSVAGCRGWETSEDLAEGDLSKEALLRFQGELQQQHQFFSGTETVVQKDDEGPARLSFGLIQSHF